MLEILFKLYEIETVLCTITVIQKKKKKQIKNIFEKSIFFFLLHLWKPIFSLTGKQITPSSYPIPIRRYGVTLNDVALKYTPYL